jgi:demethylmenaquinone methyltransferase/2-methoxy-6-polyprenyl-1,4-benzoquinol methylase
MATNTPATTTNPTKSFYDRISRAYDLIADSSEHTAREKGLQLLAAAPREKVLELGFGTGHSAVALARSVGPRGKVFGIDISEGMLEVARKRAADEGVADRVELSLGDARQLAFADGQFDAAFTSFTLELFNEGDIPRVLGETRRVLRPGGRLAVVAMAREEEVNVMTEIYVWMHRHFPHFVDCRPIDVPAWLQPAGFTVDRLEKMAIWSLPVAIVVAHRGK